jgi:hypothetical protein
LDDAFPNNPKVFDLLRKNSVTGLAAWGYMTAALAYCNRHRTGGFIAADHVGAVIPGISQRVALRLIDLLVSARKPGSDNGFLRVIEGGWQIHDYDVFQPILDLAMDAARRTAKQEAGRPLHHLDHHCLTLEDE